MELDQSAEGAPIVTEGDDAGKSIDKLDGKPVAFKTYDKTIKSLKSKESQLRELQEQVAQHENKERARSEKILEEQGEYKKLLEVRDTELNDLRAKEETRRKETTMQLKANAFLDKLPGQLASNEYLAFANLDDIAFNPETNTVDELSLEPVVSDFVKKHERLFVAKGGPKLPVGAPIPHKPISFKDELAKCTSQKEIDTLIEKNKLAIR